MPKGQRGEKRPDDVIGNDETLLIPLDDEESADIAIARQRLEEIRNDPSSVLSGEALRKALAALERK